MNARETFINLLASCPLGQELWQKHEREAHTARQALVEERKRLERERNDSAKGFDRELAPLTRAEEEAKQAYLAAAQAVLDKKHEHRRVDMNFEQRISTLDRELIATADPKIDAAKWALRDRYDQERHTMLRVEQTPTNLVSSDTLRPLVKTRDNMAAVRRVCEAVTKTDALFDALKLEAPDDLAAAIATIEATVPWGDLDKLEDASVR